MLTAKYLTLRANNKEKKRLIDNNQCLYFQKKDLKFFKIELFIWISFFLTSLSIFIPYWSFLESQVFVSDNLIILGYEMIDSFKKNELYFFQFLNDDFSSIQTLHFQYLESEIHNYYSSFKNFVALFCGIFFFKILFYMRKHKKANKNEKRVYYYGSGIFLSSLSFISFIFIYLGLWGSSEYIFFNFRYAFFTVLIAFVFYGGFYFLIHKDKIEPKKRFNLSKYEFIEKEISEYKKEEDELKRIEKEIINSHAALSEAKELYKKYTNERDFLNAELVKDLFKKANKIKKSKEEEKKVIEFFDRVIEKRNNNNNNDDNILSIENI